ncbi:MAG: murein hydrolase activator EnvC [Thermoleophilia bacterium]
MPRATAAGRRAGAAALIGAALLAGAAGVAVTAPADDKADVDRRLAEARERLQAQRDRESVLTQDVQEYTARIRELEAELAPLRARSQALEAELAALQARLQDLEERLAAERARLKAAEEELALRQELLGRRLRELYVRPEPDLVTLLVQSGSLNDAVETADLLQGIATRDAELADAVAREAEEIRRARDAIAEMRADVARSEARAAEAAQEAREAKAGLESQAAEVQQVLDEREVLLADVKGNRADIEEETRGLERRSAALADRIRAAQGLPSVPSGSVPTGDPSAAGLVWPVHGTITSGFGPRWGRMHEGLDIAGGSGTPIAAAKSGTVISAGWSGGYGNLVVVDHGGGLSTAYAHLSSIAVSSGQGVSQGTVVGGMGTTGNSTGVHLHFEVRVGGAAVNPLGYL